MSLTDLTTVGRLIYPFDLHGSVAPRAPIRIDRSEDFPFPLYNSNHPSSCLIRGSRFCFSLRLRALPTRIQASLPAVHLPLLLRNPSDGIRHSIPLRNAYIQLDICR